MNPADTAKIISDAAQRSPDPMFSGLAWVLAILVLVIAIAKPIMGLVRQYRADKADNTRDDAEATLYKQLKEQIEMNARDIRTLIDEKNHWHEEYLKLSSRVNSLEEAEETIRRMRQRLDEKDLTIRQREAENRQLMMEILQLKDRLHALEMRLAADEKQFCATCVLKQNAGSEG